MYFDVPITVTAGTTEDEPSITTIKLAKGVIHYFELRFRRGTDFRVGARVYHHSHQLYPWNPDHDLREDGRAISFNDHFELKSKPYEIEVRAYSPTASYDHTIYARIGVLPAEIVTPLGGLAGKFVKFFKTLGLGGLLSG